MSTSSLTDSSGLQTSVEKIETSKYIKKLIPFLGNIEVKGEIACFKVVLPFQQCLQKLYVAYISQMEVVYIR